MTITKASIDRMPEVAKVLRASFDHTYTQFPKLHTPEEDESFFTNVVFTKNKVYIAEDESGKIVGFIAFNNEFIDHLYLLPEAQRKGVGSELIGLALQHSAHLKLWTFQENFGARAFYEKHGFVAILETNGADNDERQPDILFERKQ
jgi:putative acetyltransferase